MLSARCSAALFTGIFSAGLAMAASASPAVSFKKDLAPVFQRRCVACHGEENAKGGYRLDTFARLAKSGDSELPALTPGKSAESELYRLLIEHDPEDRMPQKAEPLPAPEIALIKRWIEQGAVNDGGAPERPLAELTRESLLQAAPEKYARPLPVTALAYSPDGTLLAASGYFEVTLWNVETGALVRRIGGLPERITALAWQAKTKLLAVAGGSPAQWGTVAILNPAQDFRPRFLCDLPEVALSVSFTPDGTQLAAGCGDRTIRFFDTVRGKQTRVLRPHADWVQAVAFSPDGAHLVSASRDRTVRVYAARDAEVETTYTNHDTAVTTVLFSRDSKSVLSLAIGSPVHFWSPESGSSLQKNLEVVGRPDRIGVIASGIVTAGPDGLVRVIQPGDRQTLFTLTGHRDAITALAISRLPDQFATGSYDGTICIWNLGCGTWSQRFTASPR